MCRQSIEHYQWVDKYQLFGWIESVLSAGLIYELPAQFVVFRAFEVAMKRGRGREPNGLGLKLWKTAAQIKSKSIVNDEQFDFVDFSTSDAFNFFSTFSTSDSIFALLIALNGLHWIFPCCVLLMKKAGRMWQPTSRQSRRIKTFSKRKKKQNISQRGKKLSCFRSLCT